VEGRDATGIIGITAALVCLFLLGGCTTKKQQEATTSPRSAQRVQDAKPHFSLDPGKLRTFCDRAADLRLGQTRDEVRDSVGPSDAEELIGPKKGSDWKCRLLVYYVTIINEVPGNVRDQRVSLVFDRHKDKLVAVLSNIDGVTPRGDMAACR
jgi:hypothetical protein